MNMGLAKNLKLGAPTILINNAAVVNAKSIVDLTAAEIER